MNQTVNKDKSVGVMLGVWLLGITAVPIAGRIFFTGQIYNAVMSCAVLWPVIILTLQGKYKLVMPRKSVSVPILVFFIFSLLSVFVSPVPVTSMLYVILTFMVIIIVFQFNSNITFQNYQLGLSLFSITGVLVLYAFAAYDFTPGIRLGQGKGITNPNAVAIIASAIIISSLAFKNKMLLLAVVGMSAVIIVLTGSRAAAVTCIIVVSITLHLRKQLLGVKEKFFFVILLIAIGITALVFSADLYDRLNSFFLWDDSHRGLDSGFSGRDKAWKETWGLFLNNPVTGVGFRAQEYILDSDSSSHNGYLGMLAEVGIFGATAVFYLVVTGFYSLMSSMRKSKEIYIHSIFIGVAVGYLILAFFERYLINVGNPLSIIFLLAILRTGNVKNMVSNVLTDINVSHDSINNLASEGRILRKRKSLSSTLGDRLKNI